MSSNFISLFGGLLCLVAAALPARAQDAVSSAGIRRGAEQRLEVAAGAAPGTPWGRQLRWLARELERATEGQLRARASLGERRGGDAALVDRVRSGELAGAFVTARALGQIAPALAVVQAPFLLRGYAEAEAVLDRVVRGPLDRQLAAAGLAFGGWGEAGFHALASTGEPASAVDELSGARLWSRPDDWSWPLWRALGVGLAPVPARQVGSALAAGRIDLVAEVPRRVAYAGWHRHVGHVVLTSHRYEPMVLVWNRRWWLALPADVRAIVDQRARVAAGLGRRLVRGLTGDIRSILDREGVVTHVPSAQQRRAWEDATAPARRLVAAQYGEDMLALLRAIEAATRDLR